jgi:hypothetical protein
MMDDWMLERSIRRNLRLLSRQRVRVILQPGNVWVIDKSPRWTAEREEAWLTCYLRGWIEPLHSAVPTAELRDDLTLPDRMQGTKTMYRITEAGWNVVHGAHI